MIIDHECENLGLDPDDEQCPHPGRCLYKAYQSGGLTIHFHLCGDCAIKAAGAAFREQMALYSARP